MSSDFIKFPTTPHLTVLPGTIIRDDKILPEDERKMFLSQDIIVEEKIDGANLGISFRDNSDIVLQNRGSILALPEFGQWRKLEEWINARIESLFDLLSNRYILFGEWCYACHSVYYDRLPDLFLGFDIYDRVNTAFIGIKERNEMLLKAGVKTVPVLEKGRFTLNQLTQLINTVSRFSDMLMEGIYLRQESGGFLNCRAKLVRSGFLQNMDTHWSHGKMRPNKVIMAACYK